MWKTFPILQLRMVTRMSAEKDKVRLEKDAEEYLKDAQNLIKRAYSSGTGIHTKASSDTVSVTFTAKRGELDSRVLRSLFVAHEADK